jgi:hypothetical protein
MITEVSTPTEKLPLAVVAPADTNVCPDGTNTKPGTVALEFTKKYGLKSLALVGNTNEFVVTAAGLSSVFREIIRAAPV